MKLAVVHLSDIHICDSEDSVLKRAAPIAAVIESAAPNPDAYILAATGDVAFSGSAEQYKLAAAFFEEISDRLKACGKSIYRFFIPGNHDLDFTSQPDTRPRLLVSVREENENVDPKGETVRQILAVQANFFEFEGSMLKSSPRDINSRLMYSYIFQVKDKTVRVNCFNTAWTSSNPEIPGELVYPMKGIAFDSEPGELVISAFHHPYNWLQPTNGRLFRHLIEANSDVVMTGHEHDPVVYVKENADSATTQYVEGGVLQGKNERDSGFNVIVLDTDAATYEPFICRWTGDIYEASTTGTRQFVRNKLIRKSIFRHNCEFQRLLDDPGLPILHPHKREVRLEDLYVYPSLAWKDPEKRFQLFKILESNEVLEYFRSKAHVLVGGEETSGKTSLAKRLCVDLLCTGDCVPVLISGDEFDGYQEKDVKRVIRSALIEQYDEASCEQFFQLAREQRTIIIDDWHDTKYAAKGRVAIIENLKVFGGKIICFTNGLYAVDELAESGPLRKAFADFEFCEIREFGQRLTGRLIERWHSLGREYSVEPSEYFDAVASSEHKISAIIGEGILPTYPIFLISLLQADAAPNPTAQNAGSYGHILEALITARLVEVSSRSSDIGLLYTYASRIAYFLFKKDRPIASPKEMAELHKSYCEKYQMKVPEARIIADLIKAKILSKDGDSYRFAYRGCYCYFVARYFSENLSGGDTNLRTEINAMTDRLAVEEFTNIVMFYLYLTRDTETLNRLLTNSSKIYAEWIPSTLDEDVSFVNRLLKEKPKKLVLPSRDIQSNRDQYRTHQDEVKDHRNGKDELAPDQCVPYSPDLNEITKVIIAFQSLRVMGQVLRNFPGVLTAEPKYRLAEASYLLGLRTLRRLLALAEQQQEELRVTFAEVFKDRHPLATEEEVERSADQTLIWITGAVAYGIVKKICRSIGLQDLELTFQQVSIKLGNKPSVRLVDLGIHLEHFKGAPEAEIHDLEKDLRSNPFSYKLLRDLVWEFLYLRNTNTKVFQRLGTLLQIEVGNPKFLLNKAVGAGKKT